VTRGSRWIPALILVAEGVAIGCAGSVVAPPAPPPRPSWSSTPFTPEWSALTRAVGSDKAKQCGAIHEALEREDPCKASLCEPAASLAKEWLLRCPPVTPDRESSVETLSSIYQERMTREPTDCGRRATAILRDGCSNPQACRPLVERWAASCAAVEGTPLVSRLLEKAVDRAEGNDEVETFKIDASSCSDLFAQVVKGARCESRRKCEDALAGVEAFSARCLVAREPVSWPTAISLVSVLSGAGKRVSPLPISAQDAQRGPEGPLALTAQRGALLRLCGEPVQSGRQVVQARRDCKGGEFVFARAFEEPAGPVVRVGVLPFDEDRAFARRFPSLHVASEADARADLALPDLQKELDQAAAMARAGGPDAARSLARTLVRHLDVLDHPRVQGALSSRDEALAPALRELGRAKVGAARRAPQSVDLRTFSQRATTRVLGDVKEDGTVEIGARVASHVDLAEAMPRGLAAYRDAVTEMVVILRQRKIALADGEAAEAAARDEVARCGAAAKDAKLAEEQLIRCAFAVEPCDPDKVATRTRELDRARETVRVSMENAEALAAGPANRAAASLAAALRAAGCTRD
jgi:hypothetical protein